MTFHPVLAGHVADTALPAELAGEGAKLLYKHSPHCIVSMGARRRILELSDLRPELPIFEVDVIHDRDTSNWAESKFAIRHESPQAILFVDGAPIWHASHGAVTVEAILEQLDAVAHSDP